MFVTVSPAGRRYRSIAAWPAPQQHRAAAMGATADVGSADIGSCTRFCWHVHYTCRTGACLRWQRVAKETTVQNCLGAEACSSSTPTCMSTSAVWLESESSVPSCNLLTSVSRVLLMNQMNVFSHLQHSVCVCVCVCACVRVWNL